MIRLIATDLDGTLLRPDKTVGTRTVCALRGAADAGMILVAATGRQPGSLPDQLDECGIGYLVGANGAIGVDRCTGEILFERVLSATTVAQIATFFRSELPEARLSAARDHGAYYAVEPGYADLVHPNETVPDGYLTPIGAEDIAAQPSIKLSVRHPSMSADQMRRRLLGSGLTGFHATTSGAPFLEIGGVGVNKATGLALLCERLDVAAEEVLAAGDAANDLEMIQWAGTGVAMGNAIEALKAVADHVTGPNTADGLAAAVEAAVAQRKRRWRG